MSERMIELQRARLLATGKGSKVAAITNGSYAAVSAPNTQQAAVAHAQTEDELMGRFLHKLQDRDDSRAESKSGPTVPTSLSRRMLQRQGVGFIDPSVGAIASAAADRFLATVLQQTVAFRDQRLKGAEQAREAARHRTRHMEHYQADKDDRERRKAEKELVRERRDLNAIEAAEMLTKDKPTASASPSKDEGVTPKQKSKKAALQSLNGHKRKRQDEDGDNDAEAYDSIDEEEEYYQGYYGDAIPAAAAVDDDEDDDMLILRDLVHPLEAWDFHLSEMEPYQAGEPDEEDDMDNKNEEVNLSSYQNDETKSDDVKESL
jgi:hypothetical protein